MSDQSTFATLPPLRTCIGCRRRDDAATLVRLALSEDSVVLWGASSSTPRPSGRGASIHAEATCVRAAVGSNAFARAFRGRVGRVNENALLHLLLASDVDRKKP